MLKSPLIEKLQSKTDSPLRFLFLLALTAALVFYVVDTLHWPLIQDSAVMHYIIFLMQHGFRPYRDITDNNLPGAYILERCAMFLFGGGDLGWRLYDFSLLAALTASLVIITRPYTWIAGVFAGGLFALRHGADGMWFTAEREQEMAVMLAAACALLFIADRRGQPAWVFGFGLLAGMAASIKPTLSPFSILALGLHAYHCRKQGRSPSPYLLWGVGGLLVSAAIVLLFLWHFHAFAALLFVTKLVTPIYRGLNDPSRRDLVSLLVPHALVPLFALGVVAWLFRRNWTWELSVLLLGALFGLFSYLAQGKGFVYHRYIFLSFALPLLGIALFRPSPGLSLARWLSPLALLYAVVVVIPLNLRELRTLPNSVSMPRAMQADLERLGGSRLQGQVQCFDLILGCLTTLYNLKIVESTPFTGDLLLFAKSSNPATAYYQRLFTASQQARPATILVFTNEDFGEPNSFARIDRWPAFAANLAQNYTLAANRSFPHEGKLSNEADAPPETALAYRIYLRKGVPFPQLPGTAQSARQSPTAASSPREDIRP